MPIRITRIGSEELSKDYETVEAAVDQVFIDLYGHVRSDESIICGVGSSASEYCFLPVKAVKQMLLEEKQVCFHNISFIGTVVEEIKIKVETKN